jgi:hypothetical protein
MKNFIICLLISVVLSSGLNNLFAQASADEEKVKTAQILELAKTDPADFFVKAIAYHQAWVKDYTGKIIKQERVNSRLGPKQEVRFQFREEPYSIYLQWEKNPKQVDKLLFVKGANDEQMIVHPTGFWSWIKSVRRDPNCEDAARSSRYPCNKLGFVNRMKRFQRLFEKAEEQGKLKIEYVGNTEVDGRPCLELKAVLGESLDYDVRRFEVKLDVEYLLPVALRSTNADGELISEYVYSELRFNVGFENADFDAKQLGF